jgi:coenzyme F420-reducing hydrogenase alpha subunit
MHTGGYGLRRLIKTDYLARVEGEGGVVIEIMDGVVSKVHMRIFEAPRFFEAFLRGRPYQDVIDFTSRICGICPVAYQMSSVHAIEKIFGVTVSLPVRELRRLLYCGEWIESHALHVYLLQGPDFYGLESAWAGKEYLEIAKKGLMFKKLGNDILTLLGGRPVHPISVRVGGFFSVPKRNKLSSLLPDLEKAYGESLQAIRWSASLDFGDPVVETDFISLGNAAEYPMNEGRVISTSGLDTPIEEFLGSIKEYQVNYSTALHSGIKREGTVSPYIVGPLSRLNLNHEKLPQEIRSAMNDASISLPIGNIRMAIIARVIEISYAFHEAIRIIRAYDEPDRPCEDFEPSGGVATWATEAPRGILIHKYDLDERGYVKGATIVPPTSQNLAHMEKVIRDFSVTHVTNEPDYLRKETEKIIRSYDPCISCSAHTVILDKSCASQDSTEGVNE